MKFSNGNANRIQTHVYPGVPNPQTITCKSSLSTYKCRRSIIQNSQQTKFIQQICIPIFTCAIQGTMMRIWERLSVNHGQRLRPCFFGWLKQFNHSHPPSTTFNQLQPLLSTTKFHCVPFSTHFNLLQPTSPIYHPLFTTERNRPLEMYNQVGIFWIMYFITKIIA